MYRVANRTSLFFVGLLVVLTVLFLSLPVSAYDTVPSNNLTSSLKNGWFYDGWYSAPVFDAGKGGWSGDGGRMVMISKPFVPTSSSVLSIDFWFPSGGCWYNRTGAFDWTNAVLYNSTLAWGYGCSGSGSWQTYTQTLSSAAGSAVSVFVSADQFFWVKNVTVSNATDYALTEWVDGGFNRSESYWVSGYNWDLGQDLYLYTDRGSPQPSLRSLASSGTGYYSTMPFRVTSSTWNVAFSCDTASTSSGVFVVLANGDAKQRLTTFTCDGTEKSYALSLSSYVGQDAQLLVYADTGFTGWVDNLCWTGGCTTGTPTPTNTPTNTATPSATPTGTWTPIGNVGINWENFPTQVPYPTSVYGPGTPIPVYWQTPMPVFLVSPFPTQMPYPTAIYGPGTPIPVSLGTPTPSPTSVFVATAAASYQSKAFPTFSTDPTKGSIAFATSGSNTTNPFALEFSQDDLGGSWDLSSIGLPSITFLIHLVYPSVLLLGGINVLPGVQGIAAGYLFVFIIRRLQKR